MYVCVHIRVCIIHYIRRRRRGVPDVSLCILRLQLLATIVLSRHLFPLGEEELARSIASSRRGEPVGPSRKVNRRRKRRKRSALSLSLFFFFSLSLLLLRRG